MGLRALNASACALVFAAACAAPAAAPAPTTPATIRDPAISTARPPMGVAVPSRTPELPYTAPAYASQAPSRSASPAPDPRTMALDPRVESRTFSSDALGWTLPYLVYLPPDYDLDPTRRYPVLYMLHGMSGASGEWIDYGFADTAELLIRSGEIAPLIVVFPQGDQAYWMDHADGGPRWATYTAREVVAEVDRRFRTLAVRDKRAVGGLSMGADGAIQLTLNFPEVFGVAGAHSPVLRREHEALVYFGRGADYAARDPWLLLLARPDVARRSALWVDIGSGDERRNLLTLFHEDLVAAEIPHEWREYAGSHTQEYWNAHAADYLRFYDSAFKGHAR